MAVEWKLSNFIGKRLFIRTITSGVDFIGTLDEVDTADRFLVLLEDELGGRPLVVFFNSVLTISPLSDE
jgi:ferredoxin-fold anticodon binding domain-containing protein